MHFQLPALFTMVTKASALCFPKSKTGREPKEMNVFPMGLSFATYYLDNKSQQNTRKSWNIFIKHNWQLSPGNTLGFPTKKGFFGGGGWLVLLFCFVVVVLFFSFETGPDQRPNFCLRRMFHLETTSSVLG